MTDTAQVPGTTPATQVPSSSGSDTPTCLTLHSKSEAVVDAAICWNYMVINSTVHPTTTTVHPVL